MLGFEVMIWRETEANMPKPWEWRVARWLTGTNGLAWLDGWAATGQVKNLGGNGYPLHFRIKAGTLAQVLAGGLPANDSPLVIGDDYVLPRGFNGTLELDAAKLQACPEDEWLVVEAWDQS